MNMKTFFIRRGIHKGWTTPNLPAHILELQDKPLIRILRVLGGISILTLLGRARGLLELNIYFVYIAMIVAFVFVLYNIYISYHRSCYIYKIINTDELEVRNSPLDKTRIAKIVMCAKGACDYAPHIGVRFNAWCRSNSKRFKSLFFLLIPLIGSGINKVLPPKSSTETWAEAVQKNVSAVNDKNQDINIVNEVISKTKGFENLSNEDRKEFINVLKEVQNAQVNELEESKKKVRDLLNNPPKN
uniref:Uncharacterized protein n=1 Tax=Termitomyces sp. T132 TaxID=2136985 RepID=A0A2R4A3V2_9AGAR|nr:hypothetical protein C0989_000030 [Termitomyces sp. T132]AVR57757.1 hypothetical protein C0989_000031 [Termitomyces sp. T132]